MSSKDAPQIIASLEAKKAELNFYGEVKWVKITANYVDKYIDLMTLFFNYVREGKIKTRIMFTQNCHVPVGLTKEHRENAFFVLYYQFIKNAFGLTIYSHPEPAKLRINFDKLPDKKEKVVEFKKYILGLNKYMAPKNISMRQGGFSEINSHDHVLLQCLDIVLGAMAFRLNDMQKVKPEGSRVRGKKTIAKDKVYQHINRQIRDLYPHFNIGENTGRREGHESTWSMSYRHWKFVPKNSTYDPTKTKK